MNDNKLFPFGQPLQNVEQKVKEKKDYFFLGVYASAVHAKWIDVQGKIVVKSLAVASEPEIFWNGNNAKDIIDKIKIPTELGKLLPAEERFNGPSGRILDECYLKPLNLCRDDVWLCDLIPHSYLNIGQKKAILKAYNPRIEEFKLNKVTIESVPRKFASRERIEQITDELFYSNAKTICLLGDIPIREFLTTYQPDYNCMNDFKIYGESNKITIRGRIFNVIAFAHPRQVGKLGNYSINWYKEHQKWLNLKQNI